MIPAPEELPKWVSYAVCAVVLVVPTVGILCIAKAFAWLFRDGSVLHDIERNTRGSR